MGGALSAILGWELPQTSRLLEQLASDVGITIVDTFALGDPTPDLGSVRMVLLEQHDLSAAVIARTQAFASAEPERLVVIVVPEGISEELETAIFDAGAFDVLQLGPSLPRSLRRVANTARRLLRVEEAREQLGAELAHGERLGAIGVLAAGVGHEINNPASVIMTSAENVRLEIEKLLSLPRYQQLAQWERQAASWIEDLGDCIAATRRIAAIVRTLGVFSRKADATPPIPVLLNDEIERVVRLIGKEARCRAHLEIDLDRELPRVIASEHAMTQVVTNLVINALQALDQAPSDDGKVVIRTSHDDTSVLLEVADNGPGITAENLGRIFDPFFTTKEIGTGSGLGLAITRELVMKAGGDLFVESDVGAGARFWVVLPRAVPVSVPATRPATRPPPSRSSRLRVMIVDDDELVLRAVTRSLSQEFECIPLSSASEAVARLRTDAKVDALLADIVMPGMNGLALYEVVRVEHPELARRTVFFSGGIGGPQLRAAIEATGRPCLEKPVDPRELSRALRFDPTGTRRAPAEDLADDAPIAPVSSSNGAR
jgi:signal transduction histidine kinase/CheY-like chemotaxis protein